MKLSCYIISFIIFSVGSIHSYSQSMTDIFRLLPADYTPGLNSKQKDTLLMKREYTLPGGDSLETIKYKIDSLGFSYYLEYNYSFTTGQRGFLQFELRKFIRKDGSILIIYSRYGGVPVDTHQQGLIAFEYKNNKLFLSKQNLLNKKVAINYFEK